MDKQQTRGPLKPRNQPQPDTAADVDPDVAQLLGLRPADADSMPDSEHLESLAATELRDGETDDPNEAAEEGLLWVPPIDPPRRVSDEGPEVAAGFGTTAQDEPFDADHHSAGLPARDEIEERILEALRADATTAGLADHVEFDAEGGVVRIVGVVEDLEDEDAILSVIEVVPGVSIVDSRITIATVEQVTFDRS